jgi:trehalose-6-phosphate synthase
MAMPLDERRHRHGELVAALLRNDIADWGDKFLKALGCGELPGAVDDIQDFVSPSRIA